MSPARASGGLAAAVDDVRFIPGVGHAVYKDTDLRAAVLFERVRDCQPAASARVLDDVLRTVRARTTAPVNVDLAVGALAEASRMAAGAGMTMFAVARTAGWLAHAAEESAYRLRFRPRAIYTGPRSD